MFQQFGDLQLMVFQFSVKLIIFLWEIFSKKSGLTVSKFFCYIKLRSKKILLSRKTRKLEKYCCRWLLYFCPSEIYSLTHFSPVSHFYTPWKRQRTFGFLTFSGGIEMWRWTKMDWIEQIKSNSQERFDPLIIFGISPISTYKLKTSKSFL